MNEFSSELEILQDENFAIKAPKGFKGSEWKSKSGRPGRVLYSRYSPDYISSDCYITVSTIAKDPMTDEIRKRIEKHIGNDGFSFKFVNDNDRHVVMYAHEEEADYKSYHAFILLSEQKAVMMDVVFNGGYSNSKELAESIITSIRTNFKVEVTDEELATDSARLSAEDEAIAAREAEKKAQMQAAQLDHTTVPVEPKVEVAEMVEEEPKKDINSIHFLDDEDTEGTSDLVVGAGILEEKTVESAEEVAAPVEETEEVVTEPTFDDSEDGKMMALIYNAIKSHGRMTLNELQSIPQLLDLGRMGTTKLMNLMIRDKVLVRYEESNNIFFSVPGAQQPVVQEHKVEDARVPSSLDPMEQYKIDMERYKVAMQQWKKSKDFFGRTDMPKPVEPVKPKKKK